MSKSEIDAEFDVVSKLFHWLAFAKTLQRGDPLPPGITWFKRDNRWWIRIDERTSIATGVFDN